MAAGFPKTRADIDDRAGTLATSLRNLFTQIDAFEAFLAATADTDLTASPISYTSTDVAQLKSAFADLSRLARVYRGQESSGAAYDFRTFAGLLTGVL